MKTLVMVKGKRINGEQYNEGIAKLVKYLGGGVWIVNFNNHDDHPFKREVSANDILH